MRAARTLGTLQRVVLPVAVEAADAARLAAREQEEAPQAEQDKAIN